MIEDAEFRLQLAQAEAAVKGQQSGSSAVSASMNTVENNVMVAAAGMRVATAGISEAKEGMDNAKKDYDRFAALLKKGAVTQQQFDNVKHSMNRLSAAIVLHRHDCRRHQPPVRLRLWSITSRSIALDKVVQERV